MPGELLGGGPGEADDGALARRVGGIGGARESTPRDGGDVDDPTLAAGDHLLRGALEAEEDPLRVDPVHPVPVVLGEVHDVGAPGHPGGVHDYVEVAELGDDSAHHAIDVRDVAHVRLDRHRPAARRLGRRGRRALI